MKRIRCVIIEDELPTQRELKYLLEQYDYIEIAGCATDGDSGYSLIREAQPDVVFLDISIPGMSGVEVAEKLRFMSSPPHVVFTTAHSEHAVRAFDLGAVDYLLKPYDEKRVHLTLQRILNRIKSAGVSVKPAASEAAEKKPDKLPALQGGKTVLLEVKSISYCVSENETIVIHSDEGQHQSINTLQELIDRAGLFRIHKSCVVNISRIREIYPWFNGTYQIVLDNKEKSELTVSRSYVKPLKKKLGI